MFIKNSQVQANYDCMNNLLTVHTYKAHMAIFIQNKRILYQDTWLCVVWPSSDVQVTVCYLHEPTLVI